MRSLFLYLCCPTANPRRRRISCTTLLLYFANILQILIVISSIAYSYQIKNHLPSEAKPKHILSKDPDDVRFYLFPSAANRNYSQEIVFGDVASLRESAFLPDTLTVIVIHGFHAGVFEDTSGKAVIVDDYLLSGIKGNFMSVDWAKLSRAPSSNGPLGGLLDAPLSYLEAVSNLQIAGKRIAEFIYWLDSLDSVGFHQIHLVGHSLGAHVAGAAGSSLQRLGGRKVRRITGLDPAGPLLQIPIKVSRVLDREDAEFVDVIHTNFGILGTVEKYGDVDIYVNSGIVQPGCLSINPTEIISCSHNYAAYVYLASFTRPWIACECEPLNFLSGKCLFPCQLPTIVGIYCPETSRGILHLKT